MKKFHLFIMALLLVFCIPSLSFGFDGSTVRASTDTTMTENVWATLKFDNELFDVTDSSEGTAQFHDDEINEERMVIWSYVNKKGDTVYPKYVKLCTSLTFSNEDENGGQRILRILKNGVQVDGGVALDAVPSVGFQIVAGCTAIVEAEIGDYFEVQSTFWSPAVDVMQIVANPVPSDTWFSIEVYGIGVIPGEE